jgi:hypothetical protein
MVKNVKIEEQAHKSLRIRAAELECQIGDLCSLLVVVSLEEHDNEELKKLLEKQSGTEKNAG